MNYYINRKRRSDSYVNRIIKWTFEVTYKYFLQSLIVVIIAFLLPSLASIIDSIKIERWREIVNINTQISIDRPGSLFDVISYYIVTISPVSMMSYWVFLHKKYNNGLTSPLVTRLFIFSLINIAVIITAILISQYILIPKVNSKTEITGEIANVDTYGYLFVRPSDSNYCWLQSPTPLSPSPSRKFVASAFFAGVSGQKFELIGLVTKSRETLDTFSIPGKYKCSLIPKNADRFVRIVQYN